MGAKKKFEDDDSSYIKRKRHKKFHVTADQIDSEESTFETAELLDAENVREGMLLLGCVSDVKSNFLEMSLPGFLSGTVPLNNISTPFTKCLQDFAINTEMEEPSLSFMKSGMVFPSKVIEISQITSNKKTSITLSINPADINADLKPSSLYLKMVLYVSICSVEDHGYIVDIGNKHIKGFIPKQYYQDQRDEFKIGEVIPCVIKQISADKTSARIQLSPLDLKKNFPTVSVEAVTLTSILPGSKIFADVIDIKHPFIYMKYLRFNACASILSFGPAYTNIKIGKQVCGTVLYIHPITHMIYLSLTLKASPDLSGSEYFGLRKYACVKNLKYFCSYKKISYYVIKKGILGFFHVRDLPRSSTNETVPKACVIRCHYMDNLVQLSAKPPLLKKDIIFLENVQIGDVYEAVVSKHVHEGMFVRICPGLSGFIRRIHMSDVFVTKPEILYPVGSKIKCKVLYTDGKSKLNLTSKESLLKLSHQYILTSYENVQKGQLYKGVVAKKMDNYILVLFFNDIKGIVPSSDIPKGSVLFEGQTVLCEVMYCNSSKKRLRLSVQTGERYSTEEIDDFWNETTEKCINNKKSNVLNSRNFVLQPRNFCDDIDLDNLITKTDSNMDALSSDESLSPRSNGFKYRDSPVKAVIKSIKGKQLNIVLNNNQKGRVHITELGCTSEGTYPLKDFSIGQEIQVYVIGGFIKKKNNYLPVSHQNYAAFKECSVKFPPYTISHDYLPGKSLIGFVKQVQDISVLLWLSPYQIGVLDYLHFSENLKTVKSLHRNLKIGQSVKVSVLERSESTVRLTKIETTIPQLGRNVIGLVQIPCSEHGLVLKLPFGYHGSVAVTDLTDMYIQVPLLSQKFSKSKFLMCHILEVNHETKYCQLSLRKSRIYGMTNICTQKNLFCPEITKDDIKIGNTMKGFVKSVSDSVITVTLGRNLEGKIQIHACSSFLCKLCEISKGIIQRYPVGSIAEVIVKRNFKDRMSCIVDFAVSRTLENDKCNRLNVNEDISWDESE